MKKNPIEKKIMHNLKPGQITMQGFLGNDKRSYTEIIAADKNKLEKLGVTPEQIADRLQKLSDAAFESFDSAVVIEDKFEVEYISVRGKLICPFAHGGVFRKGVITLRDQKNDVELFWTPLHIHLIREHCFFEGKGSKHRLDPELLAKTIF